MAAIEAIYIFDEHNNPVLDHVYNGRPPAPSTLLPLYLQHPSPRPSLIYLSSTNPPTLLFSILQDNLLFLAPNSTDVEPLLVLEFLHRVADALEEFLGSPLLASKIAANYDIVAQILAEMADAGVICQGEANILRDSVETGPGVLKNLLGGLPRTTPALGAGSGSNTAFGSGIQRQPAPQNQGTAIPWRRSNVRHTSNELYVDVVESLQVTLAPSGRPLSAFAYGSVAFTSKVSGTPDLLLTMSTGGKGGGMGNRGDQLRQVMERAVFHPCVRLSKWKSEGVMSFIPPDGRFALCGYETDLLGPEESLTLTNNQNTSNSLNLPATIEMKTGLGSNGTDFEVRLSLPSASSSGSRSAAAASLQSNLSTRAGAFRAGAPGDSKAPALENLAVHIPIPPSVRNVSELRPTRGEAHWNPADGNVEWRVPAKDLTASGAVLRCTVVGPLDENPDDSSSGAVNSMSASTYDYDEDGPAAYQEVPGTKSSKSALNGVSDAENTAKNRELMPTSATLSFSVKGWLPSGLKVESLLLDTKKSRGLGPEVKPYKGVKYLTVSKEGVEVRC